MQTCCYYSKGFTAPWLKWVTLSLTKQVTYNSPVFVFFFKENQFSEHIYTYKPWEDIAPTIQRVAWKVWHLKNGPDVQHTKSYYTKPQGSYLQESRIKQNFMKATSRSDISLGSQSPQPWPIWTREGRADSSYRELLKLVSITISNHYFYRQLPMPTRTD